MLKNVLGGAIVKANLYTGNPNNVPQGICFIFDNGNYCTSIGDFDRYYGISIKDYYSHNIGLQIVCVGKSQGDVRRLAFRLLWSTGTTWDNWVVI